MDYILGMDVGGTNTSIGVFDKNLNRIFLNTYKTKVKHPYDAAKESALEAKKRGLNIVAAGIAAAGPIHHGFVHLTNAGISLSLQDFKKKLGIDNAIILNDFEAIAQGINALEKHDTIPLTTNKPNKNGVKVVLGAGTGLGKAVLTYNEKKECYDPLQSEEGHTEIGLSDTKDLELVEFIKKRIRTYVVWDDVLSGRGLEALYDFVQGKNADPKIKNEIERSEDKPSVISKYRKTDHTCKETFALFSKIYARFIRNSILQSLPYGGVYVAGGIAIKNPDILQSKEFKRELYKKTYFEDIVKRIPLYVFSDNTIGLKGAAFAAKQKFLR